MLLLLLINNRSLLLRRFLVRGSEGGLPVCRGERGVAMQGRCPDRSGGKRRAVVMIGGGRSILHDRRRRFRRVPSPVRHPLRRRRRRITPPGEKETEEEEKPKEKRKLNKNNEPYLYFIAVQNSQTWNQFGFHDKSLTNPPPNSKCQKVSHATRCYQKTMPKR